ncbi:putative 60s ribosomal protein l37 protein [Podospora aff. communis PSN243]|uniref:60s ribosomal protein l37 protein n=1 Tax=Podospora aff. communis PSN243 TaxID=3040156 RepID=A0AAV9GWV3_9PEZI|nr:putative 60s ribosomal protein l37 protein [Podospora aff. communis PSN243]
MARSPAKTEPSDAQRVAKVLRDLRSTSTSHEMTILRLSEPISSALQTAKQTEPNIRTSDISNNSALDAPTPASLEADLAHYQELFAKLRFSYVEQVTKEKFIRAIVGDPPLIVTPQENADLEASNAEAKAALKALKSSVAELTATLESRARDLAARHERTERETALLRELPDRVAAAESAIARLRAEQQDQQHGGKPELNLPLAKTLALVEKRGAEVAELDRQFEQLAALAPRKRKEMERLQAELTQLEAKRVHSAAAAREAKRRKEDAQGEDDLEARGRWYRAQEQVLKQVLDVHA